MLKWSSNQAWILRKKEENERFKRQQQFKNDLNKAGKNEQKIIQIDKNFVFEKNKSKINNIAFQDIFKHWEYKCPWI